MLGQHSALVTLYHGLQLVLSKRLRIGDTKYHIKCTKMNYNDCYLSFNRIGKDARGEMQH